MLESASQIQAVHTLENRLMSQPIRVRVVSERYNNNNSNDNNNNNNKADKNYFIFAMAIPRDSRLEKEGKKVKK